MEQNRTKRIHIYRLTAEWPVQIMDGVVSIGNHNKQHEFKRL